MFPKISPYNVADGCLIQAEAKPQLPLPNAASSVEGSNFTNIYLAQASHAVTLATKHALWVSVGTMICASRQALWMCAATIPVARSATPLHDHIPHIVGSCAKPKMGRVYANPIIAGMADKEPVKNWAVGNHPCHPVRFERLAASPPPSRIRFEISTSPKANSHPPRRFCPRLARIGQSPFR